MRARFDNQMERAKTLYPAVALGVLTAAFIITKTGRDALFFQGKGIFQLPLATLAIAAASVPLAVLFVKAMKSWGARPARIGLMLLAAFVLGGAAPFLRAGDSALLFNIFILIPAVFGIMFASIWLLAGDIFDTSAKSESARAFSKLGASSLAGGIAGGFLAKALLPVLEPQWLIFCGALLILVVVGIVIRTQRLFPSNLAPKKMQNQKPSGYLAPLWKSSALMLLAISMSGALAGLLIDVQFYVSASAASMGSKGNANYFANFYIILNFSSLLLQLFATPRIQDKIGVGGGLMILPFALVGGASFASMAATAFSLSVLRVTEGGIRSSVHRSIWEQAFSMVDASDRSLVKIAVDGIGARLAEAVGALALYGWMRRVAPGGVATQPLDTRWMAWLTLATVIVWLMVTRKFRQQTAGVDASSTRARPVSDCERFPDQCPCTTELGKGIA